MPKSVPGRMISRDISLSEKIASLSPESLALFTMLIPHFDAHGKMSGDPHAVKGIVVPLVPWLTLEKIKECLGEITEKTSVKWWRDEKSLYWLHSLNWKEHQRLREDRLGEDRLPDYPGLDPQKVQQSGGAAGALPDYSRSNPGVVPPEVEVEGEGEGKNPLHHPADDGGGKNQSRRSRSQTLKGPDQERFDRFWSAYPRKVSKTEARKAWRKIQPDDQLLEVILSALAWQKHSREWVKEDGQFVPHPGTYLNQRRWEDEPPQCHHLPQGGSREVAW